MFLAVCFHFIALSCTLDLRKPKSLPNGIYKIPKIWLLIPLPPQKMAFTFILIAHPSSLSFPADYHPMLGPRGLSVCFNSWAFLSSSAWRSRSRSA